MSQKVSKMLRRLRKGDKAGKKWYNTFTHFERGTIRADYLKRGDNVQKNYTAAKKEVKQERINE